MKCVLKGTLSVAVLTAALARSASADDDGDRTAKLQQKVKDLESENASLKLKCWWLGRLRGYEKILRGSGTAVVHLGGTAPDPLEEKLRTIRLPTAPTDEDAREYVARIIVVAQERDLYDAHDPEVGLLQRVGSAHVEQLVEPLVYLGGFNGSNYVIEALKELVEERHKSAILMFLPYSQDLVEVVVARKWTRDAAPILLKGLSERSPYLSQNWIEAAAMIAGPQNYGDLKFQLANGTNPWSIWLAIRGLPGMGPLDSVVLEAWHRPTLKKGSWEWTSLAAVAAHYGDMMGLGVLAEKAKDNFDFWRAFQALT